MFNETAPIRCWVCASDKNRPWKTRSLDRPLEPGDLRITDARYGLTVALRSCDSCGFIFAEPAEVRELVALYERMADSEYGDTQHTRLLQMRWLLSAVQRECRSARTLL